MALKFLPQKQFGLIAILDALGAAAYSESEIDSFLESRDIVLNKLHQRADAGAVDKARLKVFSFQDTVIIVYLAPKGHPVGLGDIKEFSTRLRAFMMHSFENQILFRGSIGVGEFRSVDDATNTVLGRAASDAAAWYNRSEWIGIAATPHATMYIQSLLDGSDNLDYILVDHPVPVRDGKPVELKAVNWPKAFYVPGLRPSLPGSGKSMLLSFLAKHRVPLGTESKYLNTVAFFDAVQKAQNLGTGKVKDPRRKSR